MLATYSNPSAALRRALALAQNAGPRAQLNAGRSRARRTAYPRTLYPQRTIGPLRHADPRHHAGPTPRWPNAPHALSRWCIPRSYEATWLVWRACYVACRTLARAARLRATRRRAGAPRTPARWRLLQRVCTASARGSAQASECDECHLFAAPAAALLSFLVLARCAWRTGLPCWHGSSAPPCHAVLPCHIRRPAP